LGSSTSATILDTGHRQQIRASRRRARLHSTFPPGSTEARPTSSPSRSPCPGSSSGGTPQENMFPDHCNRNVTVTSWHLSSFRDDRLATIQVGGDDMTGRSAQNSWTSADGPNRRDVLLATTAAAAAALASATKIAQGQTAPTSSAGSQPNI